MPKFNITFMHTLVETITEEVEAADVDEACLKAGKMRTAMRAAGPWHVEEDQVSVCNVSTGRVPSVKRSTAKG